MDGWRSCQRVIEKNLAPAVDKTGENVLFLDNLSSQCTEEFHTISPKEAKTLVYPLLPSSTNKVQLIDAGEGYMMKKVIGDQLDRYLKNDKNLEVWSGVGYSASERRIMITKWAGAAWSKMKKYQGFRRKLFQKIGLLMTADDSGDHLIKPQGYPNYAF